MKHFIRLLLIVIQASFSFVSCIADIELNVDESAAPVLVVDGIITNECKSHCIHLSESGSFFQTYSSLPVSGAEIIISEAASGEIHLVEDGNTGDYYTPNNYCASPGHTYSLIIKADINGVNKEYVVESTMPSPGYRFDDLDYIYNRKDSTWTLYAWLQDYPEQVSYYVIDVEINGKGLDYSEMLTVAGNSYSDGLYWNGVGFYTIDKSHKIKTGDSIECRWYCSPTIYYDCIQSVQYESMPRLPILMPQASNVAGNISGGAKGVFACCYVEPKTIIVSNPYKESFEKDSTVITRTCNGF